MRRFAEQNVTQNSPRKRPIASRPLSGGIIASVPFVAAMALLWGTVVMADEYLMPGEIAWLPAIVAEDLVHRDCKIPKMISEINVSGAVVGQFAAPGQLDLALLCVAGDETHLLVYWGGDHKCPSKIPAFGQSLSVVGESYIWEQYHAYGGNKPPEIEHQAINDYILEKASVVRYCHDGAWIELTGAD